MFVQWKLLAVLALLQSIVSGSSAFGHGSHRPLNDADDFSTMKPTCQTDRHGIKHTPCATPDVNDVTNWPCVKLTDLCNGKRDCPNGDDESEFHCFHFRFRMDQFQRIWQKLEEIKGR